MRIELFLALIPCVCYEVKEKLVTEEEFCVRNSLSKKKLRVVDYTDFLFLPLSYIQTKGERKSEWGMKKEFRLIKYITNFFRFLLLLSPRFHSVCKAVSFMCTQYLLSGREWLWFLFHFIGT